MDIQLKQIPFVDGIPDENQEKINWIVNGEQLFGAESTSGNEGNLNLSSVQIQKNIEVIVENENVLLGAIETNKTKIQNIELLLNESADLSIFEQLSEIKSNVDHLEESVDKIKIDSNSMSLNLDNIESEIGVKSSVFGNKNIHQNLDYLKTRLGNNKNEDLNGNFVDGKEDSGVIKKTNDAINQAFLNANEIIKIKDKLDEVGLETLDSDVDKLKNYIGIKPISFDKTIYEQISINKLDISKHDEKINQIFASIGTENVKSQLSDLEESYLNQNEEISLLKANEVDFEIALKKNESDFSNLNQNFSDLNVIIGSTPNEGIRNDVNILKVALGEDSLTDQKTVKGRLKKLETEHSINSAKIQDIEIQLGDVNSGLIKQITTNTKSIAGDVQSNDVVEKYGLMATTKSLYSSNSSIIESINNIVKKYNYSSKKFVLLSDASLNSSSNIDAVIASKLNATKNNPVFSSNGIEGIMLNNEFVDAIKSDVVVIHCGTFDYLNNTPLGSIDDAMNDFEGSVSFYSSVFKLLKAVVSSSANPRVFITNGFVPGQFANSEVVYPVANTTSNKLDAYSKAIEDVAKLFAVPILNTKNELGISVRNLSSFTNTSGLNDLGATRFINYVAGSINSK